MGFDAKEYLETILPGLLSGAKAPVSLDATVVQFVVADAEDCDFFYRFDGEGVTAEQGVSDTSDLMLSFLSQDLGDLSENKLDLKQAIRRQRIRVLGDQEIFTWIATRLEG